jgi:hypothetical protein
VVDVAVTTEVVVVVVEEAQHRQQLELEVTAVTDVIAAHAVTNHTQYDDAMVHSAVMQVCK